eukprot:c24910_g3_i1 orf=3-377(-)
MSWIFLSHSGHQKELAHHLNWELLHARHHPFFSEDAVHYLPNCHPYLHRILEACHGCPVGIIDLSHEYIESFWPMLELQHLKNHEELIHMQPADLDLHATCRPLQSGKPTMLAVLMARLHLIEER